MSITVTVENDTIKLPVHVPDGTRLEITLPGEGGAPPGHRHAWMQKYIGAVKDGPDDVAAEHDHCIHERAARGSREKFDRVLSKVPDVEPEKHDRLSSHDAG